MIVARHPELHPSPEVLSHGNIRAGEATIELGQHTDGRWMWATSVYTGAGGYGYACGPKWKHFADTRDAALLDARCEIEACAHTTPAIRAWLAEVHQPQADLFA